MRKSKVVRQITTKIDGRLEIPLSQLVEALNQHLDNMIPEDARVFMQVPGGGDWSNTDLDVDNDGQSLIVTFSYFAK